MFTGKLIQCDTKGLLTPREEEAVALYSEGNDYEVTGVLMGCTKRTARAHIVNACKKLDVINKQLAISTLFLKGYMQKATAAILIVCTTAGIMGQTNTMTRIHRGTGGMRLVRMVRTRTRREFAAIYS